MGQTARSRAPAPLRAFGFVSVAHARISLRFTRRHLAPLAVVLTSLAAAAPAAAQSVLTTLHSFAGDDGRNPYATLAQGTDGNFYGTTGWGGAIGWGTVFKITPAGVLTTLYSFAGSDGSIPRAGLVEGTDGNFYGTTVGGGASDDGTVFKITPAGVLTTLHSFAGNDGKYPFAVLMQGTDGNFYGTTPYGGASGIGTIFKITPAGVLTTLYSFAGNDGSYPRSSLVQGTDGNFYGTTPQGGANYYSGTVFKITPAGSLTTLHSFSVLDGSEPHAGLVQGTDGNFCGTTYSGGAKGNYGTAFKITPAGSLTTLHSFSPGDGTFVAAGLVQGTGGNFYGTTLTGGVHDSGVVFRLTLGVGFYTVTPCRVIDTRYPDGPLAGPALSGGTQRTFVLASACGIPATARAVSVNVAVTQAEGSGHLMIYPGGASPPDVSVINFRAGDTRSNNAILVPGSSGDITVYTAIGLGRQVDFILDVNGYFQ